MIVVIDPGVYVSAFISPRRAAPGIVVEAVLDGEIEALLSPLLLAELARVLDRTKFERAASGGRGEAFVALVAERCVRVEDPAPTPGATEDPDDDYLVALAREHHAEAIVSGDRHLLSIASDDRACGRRVLSQIASKPRRADRSRLGSAPRRSFAACFRNDRRNTSAARGMGALRWPA